MSARRILVTGGVRSGKSAYAERLLADEPAVTYVAPGPVPGPGSDPEWASADPGASRAAPGALDDGGDRRVAGALRIARQPVLVDCLGTWLTRLIDDLDGWNRPREAWAADWRASVDDLVTPGGLSTRPPSP